MHLPEMSVLRGLNHWLWYHCKELERFCGLKHQWQLPFSKSERDADRYTDVTQWSTQRDRYQVQSTRHIEPLFSVGTAQQLSSLTFSRGGLVTRDLEPKEPSRSTGCWDLLPDVLSREFLEKIEVTKWDEEKETVNWLRRGKHCENPSVLGSPS